MAPIVVSGLKTGVPQNAKPKAEDCPVRLEWNTFARNRYSVTLFARALQKMQKMPQDASAPLSYYQIAGVTDPDETVLMVRNSWIPISTMGWRDRKSVV